MSQYKIIWATDHCCYDGILHAGGRLFLNVIPRLDPDRFRIIPCMIRSSDEVRAIFENSPLDVDIFDKNRFNPMTTLKFYQVAKQEKIDLMHLHCYGTSTYGRPVGRLLGIPCILHDYDTDFYFPYPWYLGIFDSILTGGTAGAIAAAPLVRDFLIRRRRLSFEKIKLMFHPVLPDRYEPVSKQEIDETRRKLNVPAGWKIVGALTKLAPERGNEFLIDVAKQVLDIAPETIFLFVYSPTEFHRLPRGYSESTHTIGRNNTRVKLEEQARELGIEGNVRFFETVDVPNAIEAAIDVVVAPYLSERFSCARLLDAMPKGRPIIGTNIGEQAEIIDDGVNGYLTEPNNVHELSEKITAVLTNPDLRAKLGEGARQKSQHYSLDSYVRDLERWYTELIEANRKQG